jgi:hypothetical protein
MTWSLVIPLAILWLAIVAAIVLRELARLQ